MALTMLIVAVVMGAAGIGIGMMLGKRDRLAGPERKRLHAAEQLIDSIQAGAVDHVGLGEAFPVIVMDQIRTYNRKALA